MRWDGWKFGECGRCDYFFPLKNKKGMCRRFPPQRSKTDTFLSLYPVVDEKTVACAEYYPKE